MSRLEREFRQDRALRNTAKRLLKNDWRAVRGDMGERGVGQRMLDRAEEGVEDIAQEFADYARANPAKVGTGVVVALAAFAGWLFRDTIADKAREAWDRHDDRSELERLADRLKGDR